MKIGIHSGRSEGVNIIASATNTIDSLTIVQSSSINSTYTCTSNIGWYFFHKWITVWDNWKLCDDLFVEVRTSLTEVVAITRLTVEEYGVGLSFEEAMLDLLRSLSDYRQSLEGREEALGELAKEDLRILRGLITRKSSD